MNLRNRKFMATRFFKVGATRVWFDANKNPELKEAITKDDLRKLVSDGTILVKQKKGVSRGRVRELIRQRRKGRSSGPASKKGTQTSRLGHKEIWVNKIRAQRELFSELFKAKVITHDTYKH